ncbi:MAG: IS3 family transposase [Saprospiraceae bacterium]|nr:IS3 family transposase [Saprospiraceae bacterium]MBK9727510.1 IS3 family transposase [Saprospiraceae bacterium]
MISNFKPIGLAKLCGWFGMSRQAYNQYNWEAISTTIEEEMILKQVKHIREDHRRMGTRKLYEMLQPFILEQQIKIGRDSLFDLLSSNYLLVRKRQRKIQTTNSYHRLRKYPNLIREMIPTAISQLWVSDITYWKQNQGHLYISLITDAYSRKIVGYQVGETMETMKSIHALEMALSELKLEDHLNLIHHSDRGIQYCSQVYVKLLQDNEIKISMTKNGDPFENAVAERVNGIIKDEYLETYEISTLKEAKNLLRKIIDLYNLERPHMSIGNFTPEAIHQSIRPIKPQKLWKNYYQKQTTFVNPACSWAGIFRTRHCLWLRDCPLFLLFLVRLLGGSFEFYSVGQCVGKNTNVPPKALSI